MERNFGMNNTYTIRLGGSGFSITTDEDESYIRRLEDTVRERLERAQLSGASGQKAALFVCMELADLLEKEKANNKSSARSEQSRKSCAEVLFPDKEQTSLFEKQSAALSDTVADLSAARPNEIVSDKTRG